MYARAKEEKKNDMKISLMLSAMLVAAQAPATVLPISNTWMNGKPVLVPAVQQLTQDEGHFAIPKTLSVALPESEALIAEQLAAALNRFDVAVTVVGEDTAATCRFELKETDTPEHPQGYTLDINDLGIRVAARGGAGLFYGAQTLLNLIRNSATPTLPSLSIRDWPDFDRRGYFMTIRDMKSEELPAFKKSLDAMAGLKLNWLLLSIEEAFPYEPNPLVNRPNAFTKKEMEDLAAFCRARHIEISPSLQLWSHALWMTYHPDWESKMTEGVPRRPWVSQICPHSEEANALMAMAIKQQIELFRPKVFFLMMDELYLGPYGQCPRCKADPDLAATHIQELNFLENCVLQHGVRPMVCQDSFDNLEWPYGVTLRKRLNPQNMILWWCYRDHLPECMMRLFKGFQLVGHSLTGKPLNTQNMLRAIRANGGRDSTLVYWYYSDNGQFTNLKKECPDSLGGFVNGLDYMWKYRETPYWQLTYDGTFEMIRHLDASKAVLPECRNVTPIPLEDVVNTELGASGQFPVLDDAALAELTRQMAVRPEKFRLLTAPGGHYYAMAVSGTPFDKRGRVGCGLDVNRSAKAIALLMTASRPTLNAEAYRSAGHYGKKRWEYAPAAMLSFIYADGEKVDVPLRYRWDFTDWNRPYSGFNTTFAVRGLDANQAHFNFCAVTLPNPRPDVKIDKIHFVTQTLDGVVPAILAASLIDANAPCPQPPFDSAAVALRGSAFGGQPPEPAPAIHWVADFTTGSIGNAIVAARGRFDANAVKAEIVPDSNAPDGATMLKVQVPPLANPTEDIGYYRLDVDIPIALPADTGGFHFEAKLLRCSGYTHSNCYVVEEDGVHYWSRKILLSEKWNTVSVPFLLSEGNGAPEDKLRSIDQARTLRLSFFFYTVDAPAELCIRRVGYNTGAQPASPVWTVDNEAEPL